MTHRFSDVMYRGFSGLYRSSRVKRSAESAHISWVNIKNISIPRSSDIQKSEQLFGWKLLLCSWIMAFGMQQICLQRAAVSLESLTKPCTTKTAWTPGL